jgi:HSP20 family protein
MSNLTVWDPFEDFEKRFFARPFRGFARGTSLPTTDVYTKNNDLVVEAHMPNFDMDNVDIEVDDGTLTISAERHEKEEDKTKQYVVRESSDSFYRSITLPDRADADKIKAKMEDGVLKVTVPLTPLPQPKKIAIEGGKKK